MKLLSRFQSRVFQFSLLLMARLEAERELSVDAVEIIAKESGLDYADQVVGPLCEAGILHRSASSISLNEGFAADSSSTKLPIGELEQDYLQYILSIPEARLFLSDRTRQKLYDEKRSNVYQPVQHLMPAGERLPEYPGPEGFRTLLKAIRTKSLVSYTYRTAADTSPRSAKCHPWKLEYSAYDRRWWLILYDLEQERTIKAWLSNLRDIRILGPSPVPESAIKEAMDRLREPEPIVLEVKRERNALERCFLVFESQMFTETQQLSDTVFRLTFHYYRYDRGEILRKLMYLGPAVRLVSPASMKKELLELVERGLDAVHHE